MPFRYATAIYMLNWVAFDLTGVVLPFFLVYWIAQGDLLLKMPRLGHADREHGPGHDGGPGRPGSAVVVWAAHRFGKRPAYLAAIAFWAS